MLLRIGREDMTWLGWQIDYLLILQNMREMTGGIFDSLFMSISNIAIMPFTLFLTAVIYWSVNKKLGTYIIYCSCFSILINSLLKYTFCIFRPWILDYRIHPVPAAFPTAGGFSFPSGHTAGATSVWGAIGMYFKNHKWVLYSCLIIILLVMFSRNYLGVHTPQDVIVSFIVGIIILLGVEKLLKWQDEKKNNEIILLSVFAIICILLWLYFMFKSYPIAPNIDPDNTRLKLHARIIGNFSTIAGFFLERRFINFDISKFGIYMKIAISLIGIYVINILYSQIGQLLNSSSASFGMMSAFCIALGLFITFIYPCLLKALSILCKK